MKYHALRLLVIAGTMKYNWTVTDTTVPNNLAIIEKGIDYDQ